MASNKVVALLVMCLVLVAAVQVTKADEFATCFKNCEDACKTEGNGMTFCEMKCDTDCINKEIAAKLGIKIP